MILFSISRYLLEELSDIFVNWANGSEGSSANFTSNNKGM